MLALISKEINDLIKTNKKHTKKQTYKKKQNKTTKQTNKQKNPNHSNLHNSKVSKSSPEFKERFLPHTQDFFSLWNTKIANGLSESEPIILKVLFPHNCHDSCKKFFPVKKLMYGIASSVRERVNTLAWKNQCNNWINESVSSLLGCGPYIQQQTNEDQ